MLPMVVFGQKDVTTFLGIPVDGSKSSFIQKLKTKGFINSTKSDMQGVFNGKDVYLNIQTNKSLVCRVIVSLKNETRSESDIRIQFNRLLNQFQENQKYVGLPTNKEIVEEDDISYEILVKNKRFDAYFYQKPDKINEEDAIKLEKLQNSYNEAIMSGDFSNIKELTREAINMFMKVFQNKSVWFMITENYGKYSLAIFYENGYNMPHGEEL